MDPDDRAYVVGLAEEVFGAAVRAHRWPFLVDEDGGPLEADAFWPDHGVALALVGDDADRWHYAPFALNLRDVRLLLVPVSRLPTDDDGRLVREPARVRSALVTSGFPGSRAAFDELVGETDGARATGGGPGGAVGSWRTGPVGAEWSGPDDLGEGGSGATGGASGSHGPGGTGSGWDAFVVDRGDEPAGGSWEDDPEGGSWTDGDDERWEGGVVDGRAEAAEDEPWVPGWGYEEHAEDPWGDDDPRDDELPEDDAVLELGWRSRPIALAALGAAVLARRTLGDDALPETDPTALQVLVALAVPDDEAAPFEHANLRGLASRLALRERALSSVLEELEDEGLVLRTDDPVEPRIEPTPAGRDVVRSWLGRIAPLFAGWPAAGTEVDDAA